MTSYWVSTPFFTVRVDVRDGVIQRSSANYIKRHWGKAWQPWIAALDRKYGHRLNLQRLPDREEEVI
jgi:hypothetical protein